MFANGSVALSCCRKYKTNFKFITMKTDTQPTSNESENGNKSKPLLAVVFSSGHKLEFQIQQTVYLKTDKEQKPRLVTGISLRPFDSVTYGLTENTSETWHYGFEISDERDILLATSN